MLAPLKNRTVAAVGLVGLVPIALGLVRGTLTLDAAGFRAGVLLAVLVIVEQVVLPIRSLLIGPRPSGGPPGPDRRGSG